MYRNVQCFSYTQIIDLSIAQKSAGAFFIHKITACTADNKQCAAVRGLARKKVDCKKAQKNPGKDTVFCCKNPPNILKCCTILFYFFFVEIRFHAACTKRHSRYVVKKRRSDGRNESRYTEKYKSAVEYGYKAVV